MKPMVGNEMKEWKIEDEDIRVNVKETRDILRKGMIGRE
jgi:hypothetical protein